MTVAHLIERLQARPVTPVTPTTGPGVTAQNAPFSLVKSPPVTPVTPVTPQKVEGQSENQKLPPDWTPPPPLPDPGIDRLLATAMALCDRTGATDKTRQDWRADIEAAAPEHRGHLLALVLGALPKPPPTAVVAAMAPALKPLPKFSVHQPWNEADRAYQAHHWNCTSCKAAARSGGHSQRCTEGQHLYELYKQAFEAGAGKVHGTPAQRIGKRG